ncbi:MAG: DUF58 domain-containing protein [gamma proteobacterium endosymbiont of Lamellibrachia anaximandri]|nr:DUF58 domain-containing protein [gamma proteobacterium endosymbiont of Lamellibrachia anaximandri]MBL3619202.1 DUF58 domain-containing protein [gamma proteobacterium endosymbiont of Lamellibrachia anaximandri]
MHPLEALNEQELGQLTRIADHLFNTRLLLAPGHRPNRMRAGFGVEFLDHREFVPGDDLRDIDWRATARSRHPKIRRYWDEAAADWTICLDRSASMGSGDKWALAVQCAAALAYLLIHLDHRVAILLFSDQVDQRVPLGRGSNHYARVLQTLRKTMPLTSGGGSDLRACISHIKRRSPVFVISDFLVEDGMRPGLDRLRLLGDRIHALQVRADNDFPDGGDEMTLMDVESGETLAVTPTETDREHFKLTLDAFSASLENYCHRRHIQFSHATPDIPWKSVLTHHFHARGRTS